MTADRKAVLARARKDRWRERRADPDRPRAVVHPEIDIVAVSEGLAETGWLSADLVEDRAAIGRALTDLLDYWNAFPVKPE